MEGDGAYNRNSHVQAAGIEAAIELFREAADQVPLPPASEPIVIADYGCSEGRNSILPIATAVSALRRRAGAGRPIMVVHTDLPDNDFSALFETLKSDPDSYLSADPNIFAYAVGRSYFEPLLPSGTVTLGWSSWAVQWLSRAPAEIPDQVQVAYSHDETVHAAFSKQAADDWRIFLARRSQEMKVGARLVVLTMALDEKNWFGYAPILEALYGALEAMTAEGFLKPQELRRMTIPTVGRSRADFFAPFSKSGVFEGLALEDLVIFSGEDRIWEDFQGTGDANAFGVTWTRFSHASVFPSLAASLEDATAQRSAEFFDRLEASMAARLAKIPQRMEIPLAKMVLHKLND